jgi:hypothetical protein
MLAALALRRHLHEPYGHVRPEEASLSLRHRSPRRFDVAAVGVGAGGSIWSSTSLTAAALLSAAMSSCAARSQRCVSNDATIALCSAVASSASVSVGSSARNSSLSESSSSSPCGGAGSYGGGGGGKGDGAGGAPELPRGSMA